MNHQMSDGTTMNGDAGMSGSDMGGMDMSGDTGSSGGTGSSDMGGMPGMDHGSAGGSGHEHDQMPGMTTHDTAGASSASRPKGLVIGGFAAVNGLVLLAAAFLRRRTAGDRARRIAARGTRVNTAAAAAGSLS
jgi:hypothetical protein